MREIVFDIETKNWFEEVGSNDPAALDLALIAIHDSKTRSFHSFLEDELTDLWPIIERADALIGFNSNHFDIPILNKYYPGNLTTIKSIDLMKEAQNVLGRRLSLDNLAKATLGRGKIAHGLEATDWWKEGEVEKIREYCIDDVRITKELYDHALEHGFWKYEDTMLGEQKLNIDTSEWRDGDGHTMTHSFGF